MSAKCGRLEARITVASNLSAEFDDGTPGNLVVVAGDYYLTDLISEIESQIQAISAGWSISIDYGEGSSATGRITLDCSNDPFSVTWYDTDLRDLLGFTGNISAVSDPQTAAGAAQGLWLPGVVKSTRHGDNDGGTITSDLRSTVSPTGQVYALAGNSFRVLDGVRWDGVLASRVRTNRESVANESLESFFVTTQLGSTLFPTLAPVTFYRDADDANTAIEGRFLFPGDFDPNLLVPGWTGRYVIEMPRFVVGV